MTRPRIFSVFLLLAGVVFGVVLSTSCNSQLAGQIGGQSQGDLQDLPPEFASLAEVYTVLQREHIDREIFDNQALTEGAIRGMLDAIRPIPFS